MASPCFQHKVFPNIDSKKSLLSNLKLTSLHSPTKESKGVLSFDRAQGIFVHIGSSGAKIGIELWRILCYQYGIDTNGNLLSSYQDPTADQYFIKDPNGKYIPAAIFIDDDITTFEIIRKSDFGGVFQNCNFIQPGTSEFENFFALVKKKIVIIGSIASSIDTTKFAQFSKAFFSVLPDVVSRPQLNNIALNYSAKFKGALVLFSNSIIMEKLFNGGFKNPNIKLVNEVIAYYIFVSICRQSFLKGISKFVNDVSPFDGAIITPFLYPLIPINSDESFADINSIKNRLSNNRNGSLWHFSLKENPNMKIFSTGDSLQINLSENVNSRNHFVTAPSSFKRINGQMLAGSSIYYSSFIKLFKILVQEKTPIQLKEKMKNMYEEYQIFFSTSDDTTSSDECELCSDC